MIILSFRGASSGRSAADLSQPGLWTFDQSNLISALSLILGVSAGSTMFAKALRTSSTLEIAPVRIRALHATERGRLCRFSNLPNQGYAGGDCSFGLVDQSPTQYAICQLALRILLA